MKKNKLISFSTGLVLLLAIQCCVTVKPNEPTATLVHPIAPPLSQIELPFDVSLQDVFNAAQNDVPQSIGAGRYNESFGTGGADNCGNGVSCGYEVKRSPLVFSTTNNTINTSFSLEYWAECRARSPICGPLVNGSCGTNGESPRTANGSLTTTLNFLPNWTVNVKTKNNGIRATNRCEVTFLHFDVTNKVEAAFNKAFDGITPAMDAKINDRLIIKPLVEKFWEQISKPMKLSDDSWLALNPEQLQMSPIDLSNSRLKFSVGLTSKPIIEIGSQPSPTVKPLPDVNFTSVGNTFALTVPVSTTQESVEKMLKEKLHIEDGGTKYPPVGKKFIKITNVNVYGYGTQVVIKVSFTGNAKGWAYLTATPNYNSLTNTLSFPDLDYTLETKNKILKAIDWMSHDDFKNDLKNKLTVDLTTQINDAKSKINTAINKQYGAVKLSGDLSNLTILGVITDSSKGKFTAYFNLNGHLNASIVNQIVNNR